MALYRLFILDVQDNLVSGVDLRAESDREALEWSSYVLYPERIGELWCGTRCVGRIHTTNGARNGIESARRILAGPALEGAKGKKRRKAAA
jgi:hypothetical protein